MDCASFDSILKFTQIMIALIALYVAYLAKVASDRNSVAALLKHVTELRAEKSNTALNRLLSAMLNETEFMNAPVEKRKQALDELEREHREKRGLDMAYKKLLVEADRAWGLDNSFSQLASNWNQNGDAEFNALFAELRAKYLDA